MQVEADASACFSTQVSALLATDGLESLTVITVQLEVAAQQNTVLDSGTDVQVVGDKTVNAFRATPTPGATAEDIVNAWS
ncbi:hypothetical protein D3C75_1190390 [compost metagenome]